MVGALQFAQLDADIYSLYYELGKTTFWGEQLFRDSLRVRYERAVHEYVGVR